MRPEFFALACEDARLLEHRLGGLATYLERSPDRPLALVARNLAEARETGPYRFAAVTDDMAELIRLLRLPAAGQRRPNAFTGLALKAPTSVVWIFPGHGLVSIEAGLGLYDSDPAFREAFQSCMEMIVRTFGDDVATRTADPALATTSAMYVQLRLFALQTSLAAMWRSWGNGPDAVLGHSLGEVSAAHAAGGIDLAVAVLLAGTRGRLLNGLRGLGGMTGVDLSAEDLVSRLEPWRDRLAIAAINTHRSVVVSGQEMALGAFEEQLRGAGVGLQRLADAAGHSPQVDAIVPELIRSLTGLSPRPADCRIYSTVEAAVVTGEALTAEYWARNLRETVRFAETVDLALADGHRVFLEIGTHPILSPYIEAGSRQRPDDRPTAIPSLRRGRDDRTTMLRAAGRLFAEGAPIDRRSVATGPG